MNIAHSSMPGLQSFVTPTSLLLSIAFFQSGCELLLGMSEVFSEDKIVAAYILLAETIRASMFKS